METHHWDVLAKFHRDVVGCFIWDVPATSLGRTDRRCYVVATTSCCRVGKCFSLQSFLTHKLDVSPYFHNKNTNTNIILFFNFVNVSTLYWKFLSLKSSLFEKSLLAFVILVGWWYAQFKYLIKVLSLISSILINPFLGLSNSFGNSI